MSIYTHSLVIIAPAALVDQVHALSLALGYTDKELGVKLTSDGETVTHYGCRASATAETVAYWLESPTVGTLTEQETQAMRAALVIDASTTLTNRAHFDAVLAANGLDWWTPSDEEPI